MINAGTVLATLITIRPFAITATSQRIVIVWTVKLTDLKPTLEPGTSNETKTAANDTVENLLLFKS